MLVGFIFRCSYNNRLTWPKGKAGLLGLGHTNMSFLEQIAYKYGWFFSYCLPSTSSSIDYLTLGRDETWFSSNIKFTSLSSISGNSSFYGLNMTGISFCGHALPISATGFSYSGTIIDSGTILMWLPPTAYIALLDAFREVMKRYPSAPLFERIDTSCDLSGYKKSVISENGDDLCA
ncbi:unnamed protein product [Prunus armeniaca]|uniref:Peptidase A1 domain-containing protein n=1 Tax=Prunus armeniaca TaxID=36596 RepID=A0A6J5THC4_PRUAR|nr:unnamed protein product [Prunus armeniaca]